ncbi:putative transcription factor [Wickerhamomyces ciferrii]|uniref:Transcription factor n=1 Tax=Wickerhamomyces ciferrii (strain ATCC 14091 / BCRC 22168 / CBS 111 / JCM 3599 / NBRC 0793 / NRRL Y-1031 F-60-10) TaxID=1206466 RepID=K0KU89_WICCF|nr:putative transcription factor [Wickerhamomyces ciferrii]CCH44994.1 putative transcription factor [Wickerhamomyces ciferrii]
MSQNNPFPNNVLNDLHQNDVKPNSNGSYPYHQPAMGRPSTKPSRAKKMACVECRQQKSKCDAQEKYPNPCTRCSKKGISCSLQSDYKRTYKRAKFQQIEEELEELKKNLSEAGADNLLRQLKQGTFQAHELNNQNYQQQIPPQQQQPQLIHQHSPLQHQQQQQQGTNPIISGLPPLRQNISVSASPYGGSPSSTPQPIQSQPSVHQPQLPPGSENFSNIQGVSRSSISAEQGPSIIRGEHTPPPQLKPINIILTEEQLRCEPKQFGEVELSSEQIKDLFVEFVNKYHNFLPIVDVSKGPERLHRLCPVLFWVIMSVALRHHSTDILMTLAPIIKTALAEITISPITRYLPNEEEEPILNVSSVYSVQAFLIYTFWPPLTSSLSADSSWNTVGIAVFQAIRLGLNGPGVNNYNPQQQQQPEVNSILQEHIKTWISCNIVSQTIATAFGYPAFVSFDSSVMSSCRPGTSDDKIPTQLKHMVEISHFEDQIAKILNSNTVDALGLADAAERLPLLKVLTQQLNELELKLTAEGLDDIRKFQILATKVHLLTYYFLDNSRVAPFELRRGLVLVYNAALTLLNHANSVSNKDSNFIKYLPGVFVLKIWQASCIVTKLIHSPLCDVIDIGAGRQLYMAAIQLAMRASILKHDMAYRSSGIMRNMWQLFKALREKKNIKNLDVTIRTRMSASVFFDCLWILREQVGMIKLDPNQKSSTAEVSNENEDEEFDEEDVDEDYNSDTATGDKESVGDPGTVGSESSDARSTTSSQRRRPRSLSNNFNAENAARRIIRTIPLDPTPISLKKDGINDDSPGRPGSSLKSIIKNYKKFNNTTKKRKTQNPQQGNLQSRHTPDSNIHQFPFQQTMSNPATQNNSPSNIPSLDISDDWTSDMLWKDVDSVMNDFGFNTDDLAKIQNPSTIPNEIDGNPQAQQPYQAPSLFPYNRFNNSNNNSYQ